MKYVRYSTGDILAACTDTGRNPYKRIMNESYQDGESLTTQKVHLVVLTLQGIVRFGKQP